MKKTLQDICIDAEEARLYDFVTSINIKVTNKIPTMGVNKYNTLVVNQDFFENNKDHAIGLLLHESMHIYLNHVNKTYDNHTVANLAQDIIINNLIDNIGYTLPKGAVRYETLDVPRVLRTSDEVYDFLIENQDEIPDELKQASDVQHDVDGEEVETNEELIAKDEGIFKHIENEIPDELKQASDVQHDVDGEEVETNEELIAKGEGIFKHIENEIHVNNAKKYELPMKNSIIESINTILGKFLAPEYTRTFNRSRRYCPKGFILPATRGYVRKPSISLYLDVSGSMQGGNTEKALGILADLKTPLSNYKTMNFIFDTATTQVENYESVLIGGGTSFEGFHAKDISDVVLIITDCEFSFKFLTSHKRKKVIVIGINNTVENLENCEVFNA